MGVTGERKKGKEGGEKKEKDRYSCMSRIVKRSSWAGTVCDPEVGPAETGEGRNDGSDEPANQVGEAGRQGANPGNQARKRRSTEKKNMFSTFSTLLLPYHSNHAHAKVCIGESQIGWFQARSGHARLLFCDFSNRKRKKPPPSEERWTVLARPPQAQRQRPNCCVKASLTREIKPGRDGAERERMG